MISGETDNFLFQYQKRSDAVFIPNTLFMGQILTDCCHPVKALLVVFYLYPSYNFIAGFLF